MKRVTFPIGFLPLHELILTHTEEEVHPNLTNKLRPAVKPLTKGFNPVRGWALGKGKTLN